MQFAAHEVNHSYKDFHLDHRVHGEGNLACREKYGMDAVGLLSDPACQVPEDRAVLPADQIFISRIKNKAVIKHFGNP